MLRIEGEKEKGTSREFNIDVAVKGSPVERNYRIEYTWDDNSLQITGYKYRGVYKNNNLEHVEKRLEEIKNDLQGIKLSIEGIDNVEFCYKCKFYDQKNHRDIIKEFKEFDKLLDGVLN